MQSMSSLDSSGHMWRPDNPQELDGALEKCKLNFTVLLIYILPNRDQNSVVITCHLPPPSHPHFVLLEVRLVAFL